MGQPSAPPSISQLSTQHERLILELLPFKEPRQFHEWLNSVYVRGSWHEFLRDFLASNPTAPEPDKSKTSHLAKDAINSRSSKYLIYHPDKEGWTADDHHVRFIATVVSDNIIKGLWSESEWKKKGTEIAKAIYEVLSFLRASTLGAEAGPPSYES
ncbi:hypothetical protein B0T19DRAFT_444061 [Cercophora scortea]|uniref:Uncharacterized protein n=1 Tax=Cercophora scortea TaxID=314031 RepID=A0AAE0IGD1_9PEZI|nr:hypothetical protein B0T19DRAFT_444061 [Cercophora scortea]